MTLPDLLLFQLMDDIARFAVFLTTLPNSRQSLPVVAVTVDVLASYAQRILFKSQICHDIAKIDDLFRFAD